MNIFKNIEEGVLPNDEEFFYILQNDVKDNNPKILEYIKILENSYLSASMEEKILLNKVLFVLEKLYDKEALQNFIFRAFTLNIHQINDEYDEFIKKVLESIDEDKLFEILNNLMKDSYKLPKNDMRSFFNWVLHRVWNIPKFNASNRFMNFYPILQELLQILKQQNRIDEMMYVEFFTYHIMGNNFQKIEEWREFNEKITKQTITAYEQFIPQLPKTNPKKKEKKKIAFIKDRIVRNSPYMVEYSLFKNLMENEEFRNNYEIIVYSFNQFEKSFDDEKLIQNLEEIGVKVKRPVDFFRNEGYYYNHLDKALTLRETLIDDDIDIMMTYGVFPILNFLYITRTAPLQIYYSHGNCAFDIPNIDKRVTHFTQECKEFEWNMINIPIAKEFLIGTKNEKEIGLNIKEKYKKEFGKDVVILGTIGRLVKIDNDEYVKTIAKIMKDNPNTIYLACGEGNQESIKEKLKKYKINEKRFVFTGMVKPHIYGWIIDIWLDSFPSIQGNSKKEYMAKGNGATIMHSKYNSINKIDFSNLFKETIFPLVDSLEDYIKTADILIRNFKKREEVSKILQNNVLGLKLKVNYKDIFDA